MPRLVFLLEGGVLVQKTNFELLKFIRGILVRFPFVRTYRPYHSRRHETFTFTKNMEREEELPISFLMQWKFAQKSENSLLRSFTKKWL